MDRGQGGRPAHGTDETVEAIEVVGAPADDDASDEPIERGPSSEGSPPERAVSAGPPAHWLAYIRERAPWLLTPGGLLGDAASAATPDVVPHGPAAHVAPWPATDPAPPAAGSGTPVSPTSGGAPSGPAGDRGAPGDDRPAPGAGHEEGRQGAGPVPLAGLAAIADDGGTAGDRPLAIEEPAGSRPGEGDGGDRDDRLHGMPQDEAVAAPTMEPFGPDVAREAPSRDRATSVTALDPGDDAPGAGTATPVAPIPSRDPITPPPPVSWPTLERPEDMGDGAPAGRPWPALATRAPRIVSPMPEPPAGDEPNAGPRPPLFPSLPRPNPSDPTTKAAREPDGWRVRATAPDTSMVARLALPPWPDLPEPPPDDDDPDWRAIERRRQRAARLDHEQRRR